MTNKWIVKGASGSFVITESDAIDRFGREIISEIKAEVSDKVFPQVERKINHSKLICIRCG